MHTQREVSHPDRVGRPRRISPWLAAAALAVASCASGTDTSADDSPAASQRQGSPRSDDTDGLESTGETMPHGAPAASSPPTDSSLDSELTSLDFDLKVIPAFRLQAPSTWNAFPPLGLNRDPDTDDWIGITFWSVHKLYGHPCQWQGTLFDPGDTVDDLASAIRTVPLRNATEASPVTVGGADGLYLEWTVPIDLDFATCDRGEVESWTGRAGGTDRYQQMPGQLDRLWILDIDGDRLMIDATYHTDIDSTARTQVDDIIATIQFAE